jgi:mono/diheme cytochrome c family protein
MALISPQRHRKALVRILTAACLLVEAAAFAQGLRQPTTPVVRAYSSEDKVSGATLFHEKGCEHCHGPNGRGGELGPDLSTVGKRLKKEQIAHQIHDGGAAMPAFGEVLRTDEIKALVDFLHTKRKAPKSSTPTTQLPK